MPRFTLSVFVLLLLASAAPGLAQGDQEHARTEFNEQATGGHAVVATSVTLPEDGFLAIHDATLLEGKVFESVVGVSGWLDAGTHENVRVVLSRPVEGADATLIAMPHKDTNDNHLYDFVASAGAQDGPFFGGPNAIPESFFEENAPALAGKGLSDISAVPQTVHVSALVEAQDQVNSGESILVDFVDLSDGGFVAVHDATLVQDAGENGVNMGNLFSSVVGVSDFLEPGIHRDVVVPLDFNPEKDNLTGTLIPMAHKDTDGDRQYTFVQSEGAQDGAYTGQPGTPLTAVIAIADVEYSDTATEEFPEQATGGHAVLFPEVFVPEGGYAAVHDETLLEGNVLGSVIGVSEFLEAGRHRNVLVALDFQGYDGLDASTTLIGMLHRETNGNTNYDFVATQGAEDGPYTGGPNSLSEEQLPPSLQGQGLGGVNAVPASVQLSASTGLPPAQIRSDGTILVPYADLSAPGFVALHDASLLADPGANVFGSVVGVSGLLQPGLHRDVVVPLDGTGCQGCTGSLQAPALLIAMPHKDTDGDGAYGFIQTQGAQDGPFTTGSGASNTVNALDMNIVVATGFAAVPFEGAPAQGDGTTDDGNAGDGAGGDATTGDGTTNDPNENSPADTPGFGLGAAIAALAAALLVIRRKA